MYRSEIRDPVHGYIYITELEREIIDTIYIQRLHNIKQLGGAYLTYPGAVHTRFTHSIGTMYLADIFSEALKRQEIINEDDKVRLRLAALLHDIGHGPFSHLYEEITIKYLGKTHEDLTKWIIVNSEIKDIISKYGFNYKEISELCVGRSLTSKRFLNEAISGPVDVDKLDFLVRDSYFTGVEYGYIDVQRLLNSITVINEHLAINAASISALEAYLIARYEMFKAVYYHRTVRSANLMLIKIMDYARDYLGLTSFSTPEEYSRLYDSSILLIANFVKEKDENLRKALTLYNLFRERKLLKCAFEILVHVKNKFVSELFTLEKLRREIEEEIERKAHVPPDSVFIDVPTLPSIPLSRYQADPMEIMIFNEKADREKAFRKLSNVSELASALKLYLNVIRVYTFPEYRSEVAKATNEIFGFHQYSNRDNL